MRDLMMIISLGALFLVGKWIAGTADSFIARYVVKYAGRKKKRGACQHGRSEAVKAA